MNINFRVKYEFILWERWQDWLIKTDRWVHELLILVCDKWSALTSPSQSYRPLKALEPNSPSHTVSTAGSNPHNYLDVAQKHFNKQAGRPGIKQVAFQLVVDTVAMQTIKALLIDCLIYWLILIDCLSVWLTDWLVDWLIDWLVGWYKYKQLRWLNMSSHKYISIDTRRNLVSH